MRIAINGLGRIGRCLLRAIYELNIKDIEIIAVNGPATIEDHVHLIKYDSIHGIFNNNITHDGQNIIIDGQKIKLFRERDPNNLPWQQLDIDIVMECSGRFNNRQSAAIHLAQGAKKVIVSAPCGEADATIIYGVNHHIINNDTQIISAGSCTTNALAPIADILNKALTIESGFMTTIHAYTNDQNIIDGSHKDLRRARAAALSMIPTSTGAAKAIGLVMPELDGKLAGSAVRVPTANVSLIDFCFTSRKSTSAIEINALVSEAVAGNFKNIVNIAASKLVSIDFNHDPHSSIFDPDETHVINSKFCRIISWYDNEWGFTNRMLDIAKFIAKLS